MSAAVLSTYGDFSRNYPVLKNLGLPSSARDVFRQIALYADSAGRAFVCGGAFVERLGYRKETISRDLKKLAQAITEISELASREFQKTNVFKTKDMREKLYWFLVALFEL